MKTIFTYTSLVMFVCLAALGLSGCGGGSPLTLTQDNYDKIHDDMTPAEVRTILGSPSQSTTEPIPIIGGTQTTYVYENNNAQVTIVFKNDMVKEKRSNFQNDAKTTISPGVNQ